MPCPGILRLHGEVHSGPTWPAPPRWRAHRIHCAPDGRAMHRPRVGCVTYQFAGTRRTAVNTPPRLFTHTHHLRGRTPRALPAAGPALTSLDKQLHLILSHEHDFYPAANDKLPAFCPAHPRFHRDRAWAHILASTYRPRLALAKSATTTTVAFSTDVALSPTAPYERRAYVKRADRAHSRRASRS